MRCQKIEKKKKSSRNIINKLKKIFMLTKLSKKHNYKKIGKNSRKIFQKKTPEKYSKKKLQVF